MNTKDLIYDYLRQNRFMALATASIDGKPEVATVEYILDGETLLINTFTHYRKYKNLIANPRVAGVVTSGHDMTVQFDAAIAELKGDAADEVRRKLLDADPAFADFFSDDTRFFRITPTWLRLRDYTKQSMQELEYLPDVARE